MQPKIYRGHPKITSDWREKNRNCQNPAILSYNKKKLRLLLKLFELLAASDRTMVRQKYLFGESSSRLPVFSISKRLLKYFNEKNKDFKAFLVKEANGKHFQNTIDYCKEYKWPKLKSPKFRSLKKCQNSLYIMDVILGTSPRHLGF